jgi:hypothetical protein
VLLNGDNSLGVIVKSNQSPMQPIAADLDETDCQILCAISEDLHDFAEELCRMGLTLSAALVQQALDSLPAVKDQSASDAIARLLGFGDTP